MIAHSLSQRKARLGARWDSLLKRAKNCYRHFSGFHHSHRHRYFWKEPIFSAGQAEPIAVSPDMEMPIVTALALKFVYGLSMVTARL